MPKKKLSSDDALKGEVPVSDLCRKYGVSTATYYKLRDQFIVGGVQGLQNNGKTNQVKALELRIKELEQALGRKTLEVEVLKKTEDFFTRKFRN
jgi:transposase-like protein